TNGMEFLVSAFSAEQVETCSDDLHGEAMPIERAVVKHHLVAPTHTIEDGAGPRNGAHRKSSTQGLAKRADVRLEAVVLLAAAGRVTEAGNDFIEDEERAVVAS